MNTQKFDRPANIKTKKKGIDDGIVIEKPILFSDPEDGKIFGDGFVPFKYRANSYFALTFSYKFYIDEGKFRFVITDLKCISFLSPSCVCIISVLFSKKLGRSLMALLNGATLTCSDCGSHKVNSEGI